MRDVDSVEGYACVGQGVDGKTLYLSLNFVVKSKTSPKYKVFGGKNVSFEKMSENGELHGLLMISLRKCRDLPTMVWAAVKPPGHVLKRLVML